MHRERRLQAFVPRYWPVRLRPAQKAEAPALTPALPSAPVSRRLWAFPDFSGCFLDLSKFFRISPAPRPFQDSDIFHPRNDPVNCAKSGSCE
jgi:hypothetical protein